MLSTNNHRTLSWVLRLIIIAIFAIPTYHKLSADITAVQLFDDLGMGDTGRITTGLIELAVIALLLIPRFEWLASILAALTMTGAILAHIYLGKFAFDYGGNSDGGGTLALGILALFCALALLSLHERDIPFVKHMRTKDIENN